MRLLDRYLFRELLTPLAFCLGGFLIFWTAFNLFSDLDELQERKLRLLDVIAYAVSLMPGFLVTVLPVALLLALLYTLTNHTRHNEITAMRAAGVSLGRICAPYFLVGIAASGGLFALNEWGVPRSMAWTASILNRHVQKPENPANKNEIHNFGFTNSREHRSWFASEYHLNTTEMLKPQVNWNLPDGSNRRVYADRAIFTNGVWTFFNVSQYSQASSTAPLLPSLQTNVLVMPEFSETPAQIRSEIKISGYLSMTKAGKADIPLADILDYLRLHPHPTGDDAAKLLTKFHARVAAPWTCLVVVLIAIPFGAASGRRNLFFGVAGSIFICFGYFVIQQISVAFGMGGHLPAWLAAWLPNMIFGAAGLVLMQRVR